MKKLLLVGLLFSTFSFLFANIEKTLTDDHTYSSTCMHRRKTAAKNGKYSTQIPQKNWQLVNTFLDIEPNWQKKQVKGKAELKITPHFYPKNEVEFDAKFMNIHSVSAFHKNKAIQVSFFYDSFKLKLNFTQYFSKKDTLLVKIDYTANPEKLKGGNGKAITEDKGFYFINTDTSRADVPIHLWTQGEPEANSAWFPTFDHPIFKHTQKIRVTYPKQFVSLSNGKKISSTINPNGTKTDVWEQKMPHAVYLTALIIGDYKIVSDKWKNVSVDYYMEPKYENMARPIFGRTPKMIEYFSNLLNYPFPWEKYSQVIVHDYVSGAMENTSAVTFNTVFQKDSRELYDGNDDETVAHELFHHWFGDIVNCESWTHLTLNESFANYSEYLWYDHYYGHDRAQLYWYNDLQGYLYHSSKLTHPLIRKNYNTPDDVFDAITYNKGGKILHMLRNQIGDEAFFESMSQYLKRNAYKTAETDQWKIICEEVSGQDLDWFFDQWYRKGGHPIIFTETILDGNTVKFIVSQQHNFDSTFIYKLPLNIDVYTNSGKKNIDILLDKNTDTFFYSFDDKVMGVNFDAPKVLVAEWQEKKSIQEWVFLLKNTPNYLDQFYAMQKLKPQIANQNVYEAIYQSLYSPKHYIQDMAINCFEAEDLKKDARLPKKMIDLVNNSKNSSVKASALMQLNKANLLSENKDLVFKALKDSSYLVEAEAAKALPLVDEKLASKYVSENINHKNVNIKLAAYEIYARSGSKESFQFFKEKIDSSKGVDRILLAIGLGKSMANVSDDVFDYGITQLDKWAEREDFQKGYFFNYVVNSAINSLETIGGVKAEIRNKRLREEYMKWMQKGKPKNKNESDDSEEE